MQGPKYNYIANVENDYSEYAKCSKYVHTTDVEGNCSEYARSKVRPHH